MSDADPPPGWSSQQPPPYGESDSSPAGPTGAWAPPPPAPKPGVVPLRPLGVGDMLAGVIDYVRRDPKAVILVAAIVGLAGALSQLIFMATLASKGLTDLLTARDASDITPEELMPVLRDLGLMAALSLTITMLLQVLGTGMLSHIMGRAVIGKHTTANRAWDLVRPQFWRLLASSVLVTLAILAAVALPLLPGFAVLATGAREAAAALLLPGMLVAFCLGVWVAIKLVLTTPALALEDIRPAAAMRRSWALVVGGFWRTLGIIFIGTILGQAVGSIAAVPFSAMATGTGTNELTTLSVFSAALAGMVSTMVALPFVAGVTTLVYIDRRIRREDLAGVLIDASQATGGTSDNAPSQFG